MKPEKRRLAIAEFCGFTGCVDAECDYRKCQHLHKDGGVYFPETFSIPRYPDYPNDLNALMGVCRLLAEDGWMFTITTTSSNTWMCVSEKYGTRRYGIANTLAAAISESCLRVIGKWEEE